jgi:hypothetical protein
MKGLTEILDLSETTIRKLMKLGHFPQPKKVAGSVPKWTLGQVRGFLYALEHDLLPPVSEACQEQNTPRKGTRKPVKPQTEQSAEES